jgi:hypothetical protein
MKPIITILCLLTYFTINLSAQEIAFGAKAGLNISSWNTNADDTGARLAYHLGVVGQYPLNEGLSANAELLFSSQGVKSTDNQNPGRSVFNYIGVPLFVGYEITPDISVHGGIQPSFLLSAKTIYTDINRDVDIKDEFSGLDFALIFGGEYMVQEQVFAGLRFAFGMNDIAESAFGEAKSIVVQLFGKYMFP